MAATAKWTFRATPEDRERLTRLARARGCSRADLVRGLLIEAEARDGGLAPIADRDEVLRLLSAKARAGDVRAMLALRSELRRDERETDADGDDPFVELDQLAPRRRARTHCSRNTAPSIGNQQPEPARAGCWRAAGASPTRKSFWWEDARPGSAAGGSSTRRMPARSPRACRSD